MSKVSAREKPVCPELFHDVARRFEFDISRLSSPRGTVCFVLINAAAQQGLQLNPRTRKTQFHVLVTSE